MTSEQAIIEIISQKKYHIGSPYSQPTACRIVKRFWSGSITLNKLREFLNAFGYVERNGEWIKVKTQRPQMSYK